MATIRAGTDSQHFLGLVKAFVAKACATGVLKDVVTTFSADSPQLYLDIDRTMTQSLGVTLDDGFETIQTYLGSAYVNQFNKFNQSFQLRVKADAGARQHMEDIRKLSVANSTGQAVPLSALPPATGAGAASQRALETVVFGGMLATTFCAIPFIPVFYVLLHRAGKAAVSDKRGPSEPV